MKWMAQALTKTHILNQIELIYNYEGSGVNIQSMTRLEPLHGWFILKWLKFFFRHSIVLPENMQSMGNSSFDRFWQVKC